MQSLKTKREPLSKLALFDRQAQKSKKIEQDLNSKTKQLMDCIEKKLRRAEERERQ